MARYDFDLFTIGAGSGGVAASRRAGAYGARVAICEERRVGGTCVLRGCVPKKLLVYASHVRDELADAAGYGWNIGGATVDWSRTIANKDTELDRLEKVYLRLLGDSGVEDVLAYVMTLSGRQLPAGSVARGKQKFAETCAACHGVEGRGNPLLGAPNLTDNVWLHGGSVSSVRESISKGRQGQMPAHAQSLGEVRTKLLAAYVLSLSASSTPSPALVSADPARPAP